MIIPDIDLIQLKLKLSVKTAKKRYDEIMKRLSVSKGVKPSKEKWVRRDRWPRHVTHEQFNWMTASDIIEHLSKTIFSFVCQTL